MSTTMFYAEDLDRDSTFWEEIETNGNICSNCYRRIRYRHEPAENLPDCVSHKTELDPDVEFEYFEDHGKTGRPSVKRPYCECGAVDLDVKENRPLSSDETIEYAVRISDRASEQKVDFNEDIFFDEVRRKKSNPDNQFNAEKLFEEALEEAQSDDDSDEEGKVKV